MCDLSSDIMICYLFVAVAVKGLRVSVSHIILDKV